MRTFTEQEFVAAAGCEPREPFEIAANAESPIAREFAVAIVDRQPRQFDRQSGVRPVGRPEQDDAAPGITACHRPGDAAIGIESECLYDLAPQPSKARGGSRADQAREFV